MDPNTSEPCRHGNVNTCSKAGFDHYKMCWLSPFVHDNGPYPIVQPVDNHGFTHPSYYDDDNDLRRIRFEECDVTHTSHECVL